MISLILDCSTKVMFIGLGKKKEIIASRIRISNKDHSKFLINKIKEMFQESEYSAKDIEQVIVGFGPGSYTGSRIACTVAKTIAFTLGIPLFGINSLSLLSSGYDENVVALIKKKEEEYYYLIDSEEVINPTPSHGKLNKIRETVKSETKITILDHETIKINLKKVLKLMKKVKDIHSFEPIYLEEKNYKRKI